MIRSQKLLAVTVVVLLLIISYLRINSQILHVGNGYPFATLDDATDIVQPGDTIMLHAGTYTGGIFIDELQGTSTAWISIFVANGDVVIFDGGTNAWQYSDAAYLHIRDIIFEHQTGNGVNFDDGGTYNTPAHHILFENCIFRNINATGNNDLLKLSGLDNFEIRNCVFLNGAEGGSGIDMVGCHDGLIKNCSFENLGSNSIQAKGGTRNIRIEANFFKNGGSRAVNLGGSTDLPFFRPIDAPYEAADLKVYSNVFIGSEAAVAFVGCINTAVVNNTIYLPEKWVMRILQETVDESRFPPCGNNIFRNNIIYMDEQVNVECNIGPNTAPETFAFSNNLWYHADNSAWTGPDLPVVDENNKIGEDPLFISIGSENFSLLLESPARESALNVEEPDFDFLGFPFEIPRSIGAYQGGVLTSVENTTPFKTLQINAWPVPSKGFLNVELSKPIDESFTVEMIDMQGKVIFEKEMPAGIKSFTIDLNTSVNGVFLLIVENKNVHLIKRILKK